jgi:hypothetical protein
MGTDDERPDAPFNERDLVGLQYAQRLRGMLVSLSRFARPLAHRYQRVTICSWGRRKLSAEQDWDGHGRSAL